jgi:hypothetical protein
MQHRSVPVPMQILRKLASTFREFGALAGCLYLADRALQTLSARARLYAYELVVQPIPAAPTQPVPRSKLEVRQVPPGDSALAAMPVPAEVIAARFAQHATCLGAFKDAELVGYMWFCAGRYDEDEVRCTYLLDPPLSSVFDYDFYVFPQHRMGRAFAILWSAANRILGQRGVRCTYSRVSRFNSASRRAHSHLGAQRIGRAWFIRLGTLQIMFATVSPFVHVSLTNRHRVRLTLRPGGVAM